MFIPSSGVYKPGSFASPCNRFSKSAQSQPISSGSIGMLNGWPEKGLSTPSSILNSTGFRIDDSDGTNDCENVPLPACCGGNGVVFLSDMFVSEYPSRVLGSICPAVGAGFIASCTTRMSPFNTVCRRSASSSPTQ